MTLAWWAGVRASAARKTVDGPVSDQQATLAFDAPGPTLPAPSAGPPKRSQRVARKSWSAISRWQAMGLAARVVLVATVGLVLAGLVFRLRGYWFGGHAMWLDECDWAVYLMQHRKGDEHLRPIGFMAVSRLFAAIAS